MTEVVTVGGQSHGHLIGKPLHHNEKCKEVCIKSGVTLHWLRPITTSHVFTLLLIVLYMLYWYQYCFGSESDLAVVKQLKQLQKNPRRLHSSCTGMVEAMGLNPVEVSEFFLDFLCNCYRCNFITERLTFTVILYPQCILYMIDIIQTSFYQYCCHYFITSSGTGKTKTEKEKQETERAAVISRCDTWSWYNKR